MPSSPSDRELDPARPWTTLPSASRLLRRRLPAAVEGMSTISEHDAELTPETGNAFDPRARYRTLPAPVRIADTTGSRAPLPPPPDSTEGGDANRDAAVRYPS